MKKTIAAILSAAVFLSGFACFGASAAEKTFTYRSLGRLRLSNYYAYMYNYNINEKYPNGFYFENNDTGQKYYLNPEDSIAKGVTAVFLPPNQNGYKEWEYYDNSGAASSYPQKFFRERGGEYERVRVSLNDLNVSLFHADGSFTHDFGDGITHTYRFGYEDEKHYASLFVVSSAAYTAVTPDSNGEIECVVSREVGVTPLVNIAAFNGEKGKRSHSTGCSLSQLTMGNVNLDGWVSISDVSLIQLYAAGKEALQPLALRNADVNDDGMINVLDATIVQIYLARR